MESLALKKAPDIFVMGEYWAKPGDKIGYVIPAWNVSNFNNPSNGIVLRMGTFQSKEGLYGYYGGLPKNNGSYFRELSDGAILVNISQILVDKRWSNGNLKFGSSNYVGVFIGWTNPKNYDSGIGGVLPIPFGDAFIYMN